MNKLLLVYLAANLFQTCLTATNFWNTISLESQSGFLVWIVASASVLMAVFVEAE